jgi:trimethylguanosine synthase
MAKRKNKNRQQKQPQKQRKFERFWVEDCIEILPPPDKKASIVVTISRVDLVDEHTHGQKEDEKKSAEAEEAATSLTIGDEDPAELYDACEDPSNAAKAEVDHDQKEEVAEQGHCSAPEVSIDQAFIAIKRAPSAKGPFRKFQQQNFKPLANGDCGDGVVNPHDKLEVPDKYWAQRKRFFSRFDDGIRLDREGWYSVTPEVIANHIAKRIVVGKKDSMVVMDAFCGCGGNAIAIARRPEVLLVVAIDCDRQKLELAASNAAVYDVPVDKLLFIHGNACEALQMYKGNNHVVVQTTNDSGHQEPFKRDHGYQVGGIGLLPDRIDAIFLSPPWGGMDYGKSGKRNYHIESCIEVTNAAGESWNGEEILQACALATTGPVVYFLPRNINGISLGRSALKAQYKAIEIEQNVIMDKLKTTTAYMGM